MKKIISLSLVCFVLVVTACAVLFVSGAETELSNVLDVSEGEGMFFDGMQLYSTAKDNCVTEIPVTFEAWVKVPAGYNLNQGFIYSNYETLENVSGTRFGGLSNGRPYLAIQPVGGSNMNFYPTVCPSISNDEWTHMTIVDDVAAGVVRYYINGELVGTTNMTDAQKNAGRDVSQRPMCLGGYFKDGTDPFYGNVRSVVVYSDVRSSEEIKDDMKSINLDDPNLISAYDLNGKQGAAVIEDASGNYDMISDKANADWADPEYVPEPKDYDYSIALIGDTQLVSYYYPEYYDTYFDWLLANKDSRKIQHVLNMGDLTNYNLDWEWDLIREQWFRLNGKIDYTLVRGDHDDLDDKTADNGNDSAKYDRWFGVDEYTDRFENNGGFYTGTDGGMTNSYRAIEICGNKYLIITLDINPSDNVFAWVDDVVADYPEHRIIMTMHRFINKDGSLLTSYGNLGEKIWNHVKGYKNLEMVICGHVNAYGITWVKAQGDNANTVNWISVNPQGDGFDRSGATCMIAMLYFSNGGKNVEVRYYSPVTDKYYVGNHNYDGVTADEQPYKTNTSIFKVSLDNANAVQPIALLTTPEGRQPVVGNVDTTNVVEYKAGDNFKEKLDYAIELSKHHNVEFIMYADYTVTVESGKNSVAFGSEVTIPEYKVTISTAGTLGANATINTSGYNLVFWGNIEFNNVSIVGNDASSKNTLFFPQGTSCVINSVTTDSSKRANVAGTNIVINSGSWKEVCAIVDYTVIDGYVKQTVVNGGIVNRQIALRDVSITLQGTAKAYNVFGGAYSYEGANDDRNRSYFVLGTSEVKILGQASVEKKATSSGNGDYSTHNGNLYVNTSGTIGQTCAAVGPVGRDQSNQLYYPEYTLTIDNVSATTDTGFVGVYSTKASTKSYANTVITVNGGKFTTRCYAGFLSYSSNAKNYGTNKLYIKNNVTLSSNLYGSLLSGEGSVQDADTIVEINAGTYSSAVYFGSWVRMKNCVHSGDTSVLINNGVFKELVAGGNNVAYVNSTQGTDAYGFKHTGKTALIVEGGQFNKNIFGGSDIGDSRSTMYSGDILLELKGGTFSSDTSVIGSSRTYGQSSVFGGNVTLNIYGGVTLSGDIYGGALLYNYGSGYATSGGTGKLFSGNITFNIFNYDKNGNSASATIVSGKNFFVGTYLHGENSEMTGNITYNISGIKLPATSFGGCRLAGISSRMTGNTVGTLENVTFSANFHGSSYMSGEKAVQTGNSKLVLKNTNVFSIVTAGPRVDKASQTVNCNTEFDYQSGRLSANGKAVGGCYFIVPNVKIYGNSKLTFGVVASTVNTAQYVPEGGILVGGSFGSSGSFTSTGNTNEWGMYGSSDLIINNGQIQSGALVTAGSYIATTSTPTTTVDWDKYPVVGGVPGAANKNHTKLTINGGEVNGPKIYAGSYLEDGGQDHGTVELEINGGTVVLDANGITNYGTKVVNALHPCTYYPNSTKTLNCNYTLTLAGGKYNIVEAIGISAGLADFGGTITGDTVFNLKNINMESTSVFTNQRPKRFAAGILGITGTMIGNSTVNVSDGGLLFSRVESTFGCWGTSDKTDIQGDNIKYGFTQIGDVTFNMTSGTMGRASYSSGYRSNLDGNVYINISGGTVRNWLFGGGMSGASGYSSVTGDIVWRISGGTFDQEIFGGSRVQSGYIYTNEYNVILGDIYMEVTGGTFNHNVWVAGNNSVSSNSEARIKFVGDKYSFGTNGKILAHGSDCSSYVGTYTLDMFRAEKDVHYTASGFTTVIKPFAKGSEVTLGSMTSDVKHGTALKTYLTGSVTVDGNEYTYEGLTKFDKWTDYDNAFTFYDGETNAKIDTVLTTTKTIKVGVGDKLSDKVTNFRNYFRFTGGGMLLNNGIMMSFNTHADLLNEYDNVYAVIEDNTGASDDIIITDPVLYNNAYRFYIRLNPKSMAKTFTATLYGTKDGVEYESESVVYGAAKYCDNMFAKDSTSDKTKTLLVALFEYADQDVLFNGGTTLPSEQTTSLTDEVKAEYATELRAELDNLLNKEYETIDEPKADFAGAGLILSDTVDVRYNIVLPEGTDLSNISLKVVRYSGKDGIVAQATYVISGDKFVYNSSKQYYTVVLDELTSKFMSDRLLATVYEGDTAISNTASYSIETYVARNINDEKRGELVKALIKYGDAVRAYNAESN